MYLPCDSFHLIRVCTVEQIAMLHRNLRMVGGGYNRGSTNKYTKLGQFIIRKFIKIIATRCYILRLKCTKFDSRRLPVRPSLRWNLTLAALVTSTKLHRARLVLGLVIGIFQACGSVQRVLTMVSVTAAEETASSA